MHLHSLACFSFSWFFFQLSWAIFKGSSVAWVGASCVGRKCASQFFPRGTVFILGWSVPSVFCSALERTQAPGCGLIARRLPWASFTERSRVRLSICHGGFSWMCWKTLLDCLIASFSLEPEVLELCGFLFWYSIRWIPKPLYYMRPMLWRSTLASAVSAPGLAAGITSACNCCCPAGHPCETPSRKSLSCYLDVWTSLLMLCNSFSVFSHKYFSNFSAICKLGAICALLSMPEDRMLLASLCGAVCVRYMTETSTC